MRKRIVTLEQAQAVIAKLQAGATTLLAESKRLGFADNVPLREALRELLGLAKYRELVQRGRRSTRRGRNKILLRPVRLPRNDESAVTIPLGGQRVLKLTEEEGQVVVTQGYKSPGLATEAVRVAHRIHFPKTRVPHIQRALARLA